MKRADVMSEYVTVQKGDKTIIKSPGKFQNEPIYAPYFYDFILDGGGEDEYFLPCEDRTYNVFRVTAEDRAEFPELHNVVGIILYTTDTGFVCTESYTDEDKFAKAVEELVRLSYVDVEGE